MATKPPPPIPPLPSSATASPSDTFTISLYPSPPPRPTNKAFPHTDDIFFPGHLLPLRLLHGRPPPHPLSPVPSKNRQPPVKSHSSLSLWLGRGRRRWAEVGRVVKRWVGAALFQRERDKQVSRRGIGGRPCSFSAYTSTNRGSSGGCSGEWGKGRKEVMARTAPTTARTTPANSGVLAVKGKAAGSSEESSMEELQSAIQAAIAHCKKSIAANAEEKKSL